jgi:hypothetical protein
MVQLVLDTVWWRQFAYYALLLTIALLAAWPWIAKPIVDHLAGPAKKVPIEGNSAPDVVSHGDKGVGTVLKSGADLLKSFLPSYA